MLEAKFQEIQTNTNIEENNLLLSTITDQEEVVYRVILILVLNRYCVGCSELILKLVMDQAVGGKHITYI